MESLESLLAGEHRRLDDLFGRYLAALANGTAAAALEELEAFDAAFRRHAQREEDFLFPALPGESGPARSAAELRLEHTQIRELCSISRARLDAGSREDARALAANLARRFARHEEREENSLYPGLESALSAESRARLLAALGRPAGG